VSGDKSPEVRLQALVELVRLVEPRVGIAQLLRALGDSYEPMRRFAVDVLKAMARTNAQVVPALLSLTDHAQATVREGVFQILSERGDRQSVLALRKALHDESAQVRLLAVNTLKKVDDREVVMSLLPLLKDVDIAVRRRTADALGAFKDVCALEPLLEVLKSDSEADVRCHAFWALGRITNQDRAFQDIWRALSGAERDLRTRKVLEAVSAQVVDWRDRAEQ
jgi:HEAT repeat protein